jgi:DNA-directed RNA polymerase specialized sigma24 family protein
MLDINKEELKQRFFEQDWNYVFNEAYKISDFLISNKFKIFDKEIIDDIKQECMLNLLKKIKQNKINPDKNVFSFIWQNSTYRILEILRKERNRKGIAYFVPYEYIDFEVNKKEEVTHKYDINEEEYA